MLLLIARARAGRRQCYSDPADEGEKFASLARRGSPKVVDMVLQRNCTLRCRANPKMISGTHNFSCLQPGSSLRVEHHRHRRRRRSQPRAQGCCTVMAWGDSRALKSDGTVAAWESYGESTLPNSLSNVVASAAGSCHSVVLVAPAQPRCRRASRTTTSLSPGIGLCHEEMPVPTLWVNGASAAQVRFRARLSCVWSVSWFIPRPREGSELNNGMFATLGCTVA